MRYNQIMSDLFYVFMACTVTVAALGIPIGRTIAKRFVDMHPDLTIENAHSKAPGIIVLALCILALTLLAGILLNSRTLMAGLPMWLDILGVPFLYVMIVSLFSTLFSLACYIAASTGHPRRRALALAGALVVLAPLLVQFQYEKPIYKGLGEDVTQDGIVLQSGPYSCVPASGANLARQFEIKVTEKGLARLMGTSCRGTRAAQAVFGMKAIGIDCTKIRLPRPDPYLIKPPAILSVDLPETGPESHAIYFKGIEPDVRGRAVIYDPLYGRRLMSIEQLKSVWRGTGLECSVLPGA